MQWNAPFSLANTEPHSISEWMYTTSTTGWRVVAHNAVETYCTFITTDHRYPCMRSYQFCASASNAAAGDGEKSGQVEGYFLQSDLMSRKYWCAIKGALSSTYSSIQS